MRPALPALAILASSLLMACSDQPMTEPTADPALSSASGLAAAARVTLHFPLEGPFDLGFTSPCTGGSVEGTGEIAGHVNVVGVPVAENVLLGLHVEEHGVVTGTVTDQSTGDTYRFHNSYHNSFNTPSGPAPNFTATSTGTLVAFPTDGSGSGMRIQVTIHTTVDGNGVQRATVEADNFKCLR